MNQEPVREHLHPAPSKYLVIASILTVLTLIEIGVYYLDFSRNLFIFVLVMLSAFKFSLVIMYYMHLRFDHRLYTGLFVFGLFIAGSILFALFGLFRIF